MDWSESDDVALKGLVDKYGQNWSLVADVFNSETKRVQTDRREGWDMWSRWNSKYGAKAEQSQFTPAAKRQAKKERHHRGMYESMRRAKHRRESLPPRLAPTAPRRINLNAHDTHAVPMPRSTNPRELSRWKCERDAAAAAANENYQRQLIRQQQYMTAQARLQAHHQAVARNQQMIQAQAQQAAGVSFTWTFVSF